MSEIQTNEFFAPANTSLFDGLVAEYRQKRSLIERFHGDFKDGDIGRGHSSSRELGQALIRYYK